MANEEFDEKRDFILEQQAQFSVDIQRLRETQTQTERVLAQTGEIVTRLANVTLVGFKEVNTKINALVDSQIRTEEKFQTLADSQVRIAESHLETDEKIKTLVDSQLQSVKRISVLEDLQMRAEDDRRN